MEDIPVFQITPSPIVNEMKGAEATAQEEPSTVEGNAVDLNETQEDETSQRDPWLLFEEALQLTKGDDIDEAIELLSESLALL